VLAPATQALYHAAKSAGEGESGMAERVMIVCDVCGAAPADTIAIRYRDRSLQKDLCAKHMDELIKGARAPRRGRPRSAPVAAPANAAPRRRGRPRKVAQT
jgi:hypothetical protein